MLSKLAITALVGLLVWLVFFRRPAAKRRGGTKKALPHPLSLARCPGCGVYRLPEAPCDCTRPPKGP